MNALFTYTLRIADDSLILGQRLSEWCGHGPVIEEDIAMTNIALDLIGQATSLLEYAGKVENKGRSADDLAFLRLEHAYFNTQLVEQENKDFGVTMIRQWIFDSFRVPFFEALQQSLDKQLAAIAEKSLKETKYHWKHSAEWVIRLGDGTTESHERVQQALDSVWKYAEELFYMDEVDQELIAKGIAVDLEKIRPEFNQRISQVITESTLKLPELKYSQKGGRVGRHTEHLGRLLAEMQYMQRAYPNMEW